MTQLKSIWLNFLTICFCFLLSFSSSYFQWKLSISTNLTNLIAMKVFYSIFILCIWFWFLFYMQCYLYFLLNNSCCRVTILIFFFSKKQLNFVQCFLSILQYFVPFCSLFFLWDFKILFPVSWIEYFKKIYTFMALIFPSSTSW